MVLIINIQKQKYYEVYSTKNKKIWIIFGEKNPNNQMILRFGGNIKIFKQLIIKLKIKRCVIF